MQQPHPRPRFNRQRVPCTHCANHGRRPFTPTECRRCATTQPPITHQHQLKHCAAQLRCMRIPLLQALSARQTPPSFVLSTLALRSGPWKSLPLTFLRDVFGPSSKEILSARNAHHSGGVVGVQPQESAPSGSSSAPIASHSLSQHLFDSPREGHCCQNARPRHATQQYFTHSEVAESTTTFSFLVCACMAVFDGWPSYGLLQLIVEAPSSNQVRALFPQPHKHTLMITLHLVFIAECGSFHVLTVATPNHSLDRKVCDARHCDRQ
jgi:hypothetical protein